MSIAFLVRADALGLPLADESVDLIVTSPPYFALRSYQDGGEHYDGQLGAEATPAEFVDALIAATSEMVRVLKPTGSIFVNLGDKYSRGSRPLAQPDQFRVGDSITYNDPKYVKNTAPENSGVASKSLMGIPWRYAIRCIDDLDLILRAEIIWAKPNGLPESVTDRVARKHEQWFHFTKSERYFSAIDTIRESHVTADALTRVRSSNVHGDCRLVSPTGTSGNPLGKLPGSVWTIATEPLRVPDELGVDHFAAFPTEFPRRIIIGWSPSGICTTCGEGRRPLVRRTAVTRSGWEHRKPDKAHEASGKPAWSGQEFNRIKAQNPDVIMGEACACPDTTAPTRPAVVLDPFGGTGTTAAVARALGRHGVSVDLSADYLRLADWRCNGTGHDAIRKKLGQQVVTVSADQMSLEIT